MTERGTRKQAQVQEVVIRPSRGWLGFRWRELWAYRELLFFLTWRDVKVRYKQTFFGAAWAVIQPLALMVVFTGLFGGSVKEVRGAENIPPAIYFYTGLVPWALFQASLTGSSMSVVSGANLVTRVYFPRLIMPIAATGSFLIDFFIAFVVLIGMMVLYGIEPTTNVLWVPVFTLLALISALGVGIGMSALNVKYRDVGYAVPFLLTLLLFLSPVAYPATGSYVPEALRPIYGLNPMVGVIEGFRWALLSVGDPPGLMTLVSAIVAVCLFIAAVIYFHRFERSFADVI